MQTSQPVRIAHHEILITSIQNTTALKDAVDIHQNCCYLPLTFLKDWPSNLNVATIPWYSARTKKKHLADGFSKIKIGI